MTLHINPTKEELLEYKTTLVIEKNLEEGKKEDSKY